MPKLIVVPPKTCEQCGATFHRRPRRPMSKWRTAKYCSPACARAARQTPPKKCEWCGDPIKVGPRQSAKKRRFCSLTCSHKNERAREVSPKTRYRTRYVGKTRMARHRMIAETMMFRPLRPNEVVHHRDLNKKNDDPMNLRVMDRVEHGRLHARIEKERRLAA